MDRKEFDRLIDAFHQQGLNNDNIMEVLYKTFKEGKCDLEDYELMVSWMGYTLTDIFYKDNKINKHDVQKIFYLQDWLEQNKDAYKREYVIAGKIIVTKPEKCPKEIMEQIDEFNDSLDEARAILSVPDDMDEEQKQAWVDNYYLNKWKDRNPEKYKTDIMTKKIIILDEDKCPKHIKEIVDRYNHKIDLCVDEHKGEMK